MAAYTAIITFVNPSNPRETLLTWAQADAPKILHLGDEISICANTGVTLPAKWKLAVSPSGGLTINGFTATCPEDTQVTNGTSVTLAYLDPEGNFPDAGVTVASLTLDNPSPPGEEDDVQT